MNRKKYLVEIVTEDKDLVPLFVTNYIISGLFRENVKHSGVTVTEVSDGKE
jgi:hypothetical protein